MPRAALNHHESSHAVMSEHLGDLPTNDVAMSVNMFPTDPNALLDTKGYQALADLMYEGGELKEPLDASKFIDSSYLERASGMGCGKM